MIPADANDSELLRMLRGDAGEEAFLILYEKYFKQVYFTSRKYLHAEDAYDVCQEIFLALWEKRHKLNEINNLKGYITGMTQHRIYDRFRHAQVEQRMELEFLKRSEKSENPEHTLRQHEYDHLVREAIDQLPPKQRQVYKLIREEGLSHEVTARQLNTSKDAVEKNMGRALSFLRKRIGPHLTTVISLLIIMS